MTAPSPLDSPAHKPGSPADATGEPAIPRAGWKAALVAMGVFGALLCLIFKEGFTPDQVLFSNDTPLGLVKHFYDDSSGGEGVWWDLNWLGSAHPGGAPNFTRLVFEAARMAGPDAAEIRANVYAPLCLWVLAMSAWLFLRQFGCSAPVCLLGGLAAMLNGTFFSYACWGLPMRALGAAATFLALAALLSGRGWRLWTFAVLAGLAVGQGVMEAYDVGAIFSLYAAALGFFCVANAGGWTRGAVARGTGAVAVMALSAGLMAWQSLDSLRGTQTQGLAAPGIPAEARWEAATQWSVPKSESLGIVVAGLFGYRMDSPEGGNYWGGIGRSAGWDTDRQGMPFHAGYGFYAGTLVCLLALLALVQSARADGPFSLRERRFVWFCGVLAGLSLLLAWGRHAVFYEWIHPLPFFRDIRNPDKFMQPLAMLLVILGGLGLHSLGRCYLEKTGAVAGGWFGELSATVHRRGGFERRWILGLVALMLAVAAGWLAYTATEESMVKKLQPVAAYFPMYEGASDTPGARTELVQATAESVVRHSFRRVGWAVLFLFLSMAVVLAAMTTRHSRATVWAVWVVAGVLLAVDLGNGNKPYQKYFSRSRDVHFSAALDDIESVRGVYATAVGGQRALRLIKESPGRERVALLQNERALMDMPSNRVGVISLDTHLVRDSMRWLPVGADALTNASSRQVVQRFWSQLPRGATPEVLLQMHVNFYKLVQQSGATDPQLNAFFQQSLQSLDRPVMLTEASQRLTGLYSAEWAQHAFHYHGVPSLDVVMDPRPKQADQKFREAMGEGKELDAGGLDDWMRLRVRKWELTSTRFIMCVSGNPMVTEETRRRYGALGYTNALSRMLDPHLRRFNTVATFGPSSEGAPEMLREIFSLVEFEGALPRIKLYADWRQGVADEDALRLLASPAFDPHREVLVAESGLPEPEDPLQTESLPPAKFTSYAPRRVSVETPATTVATLLLFNDRHDPHWNVKVDGKPAALLRANYLMRGVALPASPKGHQVEFIYNPPSHSLRTSMAAGVIGLLIGGAGMICGRRRREP